MIQNFAFENSILPILLYFLTKTQRIKSLLHVTNYATTPILGNHV